MRLTLVSMPWLDCHVPSAALAGLKAYLDGRAAGLAASVWPEHVEVSRRLGSRIYRSIQEDSLAGEALYARLVYPHHHDELAGLLQAAAARSPWAKEDPAPAWAAAPERIVAELDAHASELAARLAGACDVVGLATTFRQLFANVLLSRKIKAANPHVHVAWGGSLLQGKAGPSFLREYPEIDSIIQGEGERPLQVLLEHLASGNAPPAEEAGILTRANLERFPDGVPKWEAEDVESLPCPDFKDFAVAADPLSLEWRIWLQTARGCWWDRSGRTGNPRHRCLFCNMNERRVYQAKPARQVAAEVDALVERHANPRVVLSDLCMRPTGLLDLGRRLARLGRGLQLQVEFRAGVRPQEVLAMWEAGLTLAHTGVEGFSTAYLRRMGKGTTVIQNLEVLKTCAELEIANPFGLVTEFPGSTADEVAESVENIERYATAYPPPGPISEFNLAAGSAVDLCRGEFGVLDVRNHSRYAEFLPADVCRRLVLPVWEWDYAPDGRPADWSPVLDACRRWREMHEDVRARALREGRTPQKVLQYLDGRDFLEITDCRREPRRLTLSSLAREVYLECLEVRPFEELERHFADRIESGRIREILDRCVAERIMFFEDGRYLSLAVASRPDIAARRIRETRRPRRPKRYRPA